jgi:hypothetical protein
MDETARRTLTAQADAYDLAVELIKDIKPVVTQFDAKAPDEDFCRAIEDRGIPGYSIRVRYEEPEVGTAPLLSIKLVPDAERVLSSALKKYITRRLPEPVIDMGGCYLTHPTRRIDAKALCTALDGQAGVNQAKAVALRGAEERAEGYKDELAQLLAGLMNLKDRIEEGMPPVAKRFVEIGIDTHNITSNYEVRSRAQDYYRAMSDETKDAEGVGREEGVYSKGKDEDEPSTLEDEAKAALEAARARAFAPAGRGAVRGR